jgi:hypothetical protein
MTDKPKLKIEFAPGAFDGFEGTQEELDVLIGEITTMFAELTPEELSARSRPLTEKDFNDLPDEVKQQLASALDNDNTDTRTLQ